MNTEERLSVYASIAQQFDALNFGGDVELANTAYMTKLLELAAATHPHAFQGLRSKYLTLPPTEYGEFKRLTCQ